MLNKKFNNRKPDIWFKNHNLIIEVDEGNHENYDSDVEKEREAMFKKHNFTFFRCNPNDPNFDLFQFLGKINLHISKLREENATNKANNKAINKIAEDFEKNSSSDKIKRMRTICQKHFTKLQKMKKTQSAIKPIKIGKNLEQHIVLGAKIICRILGHKN